MSLGRAGLALLVPMVLLPRLVFGGPPLVEGRALLAAYDEEPARIDRALEILAAAVAADPEPETLIELARACFLVGELRARSVDERLAAYERGRDAGRRAIASTPRSDRAHLWYAVNEGRWVELKGALRALFVLSRLRETADTILALNPSSVEGWIRGQHSATRDARGRQRLHVAEHAVERGPVAGGREAGAEMHGHGV